MTTPSRALIAYALISKHLQHGNGAPDIEQAVMEFFRAMAVGMAHKPFDVDEFCSEARKFFGMNIPTPIARSWAPRLEKAGILKAVRVTRVGKQEYKEYVYCEVAGAKDDAEAEVQGVLSTFRDYFRAEFATQDGGCGDEQIDEAFLLRLLHLESLRVLAKRHRALPSSTIGVKRTPKTLALGLNKAPKAPVGEQGENRLATIFDVAVADFLLSSEKDNPKFFERISSVAYANLAVETLIAFAEPAGDGQAFGNAQVFFDTPLILDILQLHPDREDYGAEFKAMVSAFVNRPVA